MIEYLQQWYKRNFSNPNVVILAISLIVIFAVLLLLGEILLPLLISLVLAYLLESVVKPIEARGFSRRVAAITVFSLFMVVFVVGTVLLAPLIAGQIAQFVDALPEMIATIQSTLMHLPAQYPDLITRAQIENLMATVGNQIAEYGDKVLTYLVGSLRGIIKWLVYIVLIIMLLFFFLKDKPAIMAWMNRFLPQNRQLASQVWAEVDMQIGNYIRGKMVEVLIVGIATYIGFVILGLNYAALLALLVGLSVIVPFVGAVVVTIPVVLTAFFQWGFAPDFWYLLIVYTVIQGLDGNVLVPVLFSEAVNLHPAAIVIAIIFFGGIWGFWGVFFAIPLATLVKAVINAWPRTVANEP